ncbi:MAG: hypothetical protein UU80_C0031G0012 [candidate division WWE3 bacterium GW2011_GWA1_41_8]|uniref:Uncharacterized protein n=2 Tax=Katanobacteria TaxID=422282 RepID=A0A0G0X8R5_UNCKA|nr:MAG: hypothetical protein UU72_C0041G0013 [candidate division WWE3 bacterium GW2011_GWB1_41_6]KKS21310.1 MAG: hypothetical protein UU80_C0031G0012 [candidate division WWE3 bacterium GW2011_GWA1_41_8]
MSKALSTRAVRVISSITACALDCFVIEGSIKRVIRCLLPLLDTLHIVHVIVMVVNDNSLDGTSTYPHVFSSSHQGSFFAGGDLQV